MSECVESRTLPDTLLGRGMPAFFLDVDGTLLDFADDPESVFVPPGLSETLKFLHDELRGGLALVTARDAAFIDRIFPWKPPLSAEHGCQIRYKKDAELQDLVDRPDFDEFSPVFDAAVRGVVGARSEERAFARVFHWRTAHGGADQCKEHFQHAAEQIIASYNASRQEKAHLHITHGAMVLEIGPAGADKGRAVDAFMNSDIFQGRRPVFIGDSPHSDGFGMRAARALGGCAVGVGPAMNSQEGLSLCDAWFAGPSSVREFLDQMIVAMRAQEQNFRLKRQPKQYALES